MSCVSQVLEIAPVLQLERHASCRDMIAKLVLIAQLVLSRSCPDYAQSAKKMGGLALRGCTGCVES